MSSGSSHDHYSKLSPVKLFSSTDDSSLPVSSHSIENHLIPNVIDNPSVGHLETLASVLPILDSHSLFSFTN